MQAALTESRQGRPAGSALCQAVAEGVGGGIGPPARAYLAVEVGDMPLDGVGAQPKAPSDLRVGLPSSDQPQHLTLARAQAICRLPGMAARSPGRGSRWRLGWLDAI